MCRIEVAGKNCLTTIQMNTRNNILSHLSDIYCTILVDSKTIPQNALSNDFVRPSGLPSGSIHAYTACRLKETVVVVHVILPDAHAIDTDQAVQSLPWCHRAIL